MATEAQRKRLAEAVKNGGRLNPHGMQDASLAGMFREGLIEARLTADRENLVVARDSAVLDALRILEGERVGPRDVSARWQDALRRLQEADELQGRLRMLDKAEEWMARGRALDRFDIVRFSGVLGVFVTDAGKLEARAGARP